MRILYVDQTGQLGGGELSLLDVIRNSEHESEIVLFSDGPFRRALEDLDVRVHLLSLGKTGDIRREASISSVLNSAPALLKLRNELAWLARGFDLIYANSQKAFLLSAFARDRSQPLIWHLRDMLTADHFSPIMRRVAVLAGNHSASAIVMNSQATRESFVKAGGRRDKTNVVYNGIDVKPFNAVTERDVQTLRDQLNLNGGFVAGVFGRLTPWKGQHIAIEAAARLDGVHIVMVGDALFGEQSYADELRQRAASHGIADRVHFLGFRSDIAPLMKMVDVVIHCSTAPEPFGRVIVEAMLAGRPVIATRAGGVTEIVQDEQTGLLVAPNSSSQLTAAIARLQQDAHLATSLSHAGRARAAAMFSVEAMMLGIEGVLSSVRLARARALQTQ